MQQFVINEKTLRSMLTRAFKDGFECPSDMMDQQIANTYNKYISKHYTKCQHQSLPSRIKLEKESEIKSLQILFKEIKQRNKMLSNQAPEHHQKSSGHWPEDF